MRYRSILIVMVAGYSSIGASLLLDSKLGLDLSLTPGSGLLALIGRSDIPNSNFLTVLLGGVFLVAQTLMWSWWPIVCSVVWQFSKSSASSRGIVAGLLLTHCLGIGAVVSAGPHAFRNVRAPDIPLLAPEDLIALALYGPAQVAIWTTLFSAGASCRTGRTERKKGDADL